MKKVIKDLGILLFVIILMPSFVLADTDLSNKIYVGFGKADITPIKNGQLMEDIPIAGSGSSQNRLAEPVIYDGVEMPVFPGQELIASAVAIRDFNGNTIVFVTCDLLLLNQVTHDGSLTAGVREYINREYGIPLDSIIISTTHTHSGVDTAFSMGDEYPDIADAVTYYKTRILSPGIRAAVREALDNLSLATVYIGSVDIVNNNKNVLNFDRHYTTSLNYFSDNERSIYYGENHGLYGYDKLDGKWYLSSASGKLTGHVTEGDPTLQMIRFVFNDEKKDILMVNWQVHPLITGGINFKTISSDVIGSFRNELEKTCNCNVAYYNGAAGDLQVDTNSQVAGNNGEGINGLTHNYSRTTSEEKNEASILYGKELAKYVRDNYSALRKTNVGIISDKKQIMTLATKSVNDAEYNNNSSLLVNAKFCKLIWEASFSVIENIINGELYPDNIVCPKDLQTNGQCDASKLRNMIRTLPNYMNYFNDSGDRITFKKEDRSYIRLLVAFIGQNFTDGTIESVYHANAVVSNNQKQASASDVKVRTITMGDISFVVAPYEMFNKNGKYIKQNATSYMTFILGYSDGHLGYIPTSDAYEYGCYEADTSAFKKGSGEELATKYVNMINNLYTFKNNVRVSNILIKNDNLLIIKNNDLNMPISTFINNIFSDASLSLVNNNNEEINDRSIVKTGDNLIVSDNEDNINYTIINVGDVNSDGASDINDASILTRYILGDNPNIKMYNLLAGDMNDNYDIKMNDVVMLLKNGM